MKIQKIPNLGKYIGSLRKSAKQTNAYRNLIKDRDNTEIIKIRNQKANITDTEEIQKAIMIYFQVQYSTILEDLKEMANGMES